MFKDVLNLYCNARIDCRELIGRLGLVTIGS